MAYQARLEIACSVSLPWVRIPLSPPFDSCNLVAWKGTCNQNPKIPVFIIRYNTTSYTGALRPSPYRSFISTAYPLYSRRICAKLHPGGLAAVRIQPGLRVRPVAGRLAYRPLRPQAAYHNRYNGRSSLRALYRVILKLLPAPRVSHIDGHHRRRLPPRRRAAYLANHG